MGLKVGVFTALTVFFVEIVLALDGRAGIMQLVLLTSSMVGLPLFVHLAGKWEKHTTLVVAAAVSAAGGLLAFVIPTGSVLAVAGCYFLVGFRRARLRCYRERSWLTSLIRRV